MLNQQHKEGQSEEEKMGEGGGIRADDEIGLFLISNQF